MNTDKYVAGTYEIETQFESFENYLPNLKLIGWVDTAITYNNDYFLGESSLMDSLKVISKISPVMYRDYDWWVSNHINSLKKTKIDIMLVHNTRHNDWIKLYSKLLEDYRFNEVGISNASISQLDKIKDKFGEYPKWVEIELNPEYLDLNYIKFCKDNDIKIISYAIFGGKYKARTNIANLSLSYLIKLAETYSNKIILRWDNYGQYNQIFNNCILYSNKIHIQNKSSINKCIIPEVYNLPRYINLDYSGFPRYLGRYIGREIVENKNINLSEFTEFDGPKLEFITEYRAYLRYNNKLDNEVCILTDKGEVTKVYKDKYKVYINECKD